MHRTAPRVRWQAAWAVLVVGNGRDVATEPVHQEQRFARGSLLWRHAVAGTRCRGGLRFQATDHPLGLKQARCAGCVSFGKNNCLVARWKTRSMHQGECWITTHESAWWTDMRYSRWWFSWLPVGGSPKQHMPGLRFSPTWSYLRSPNSFAIGMLRSVRQPSLLYERWGRRPSPRYRPWPNCFETQIDASLLMPPTL